MDTFEVNIDGLKCLTKEQFFDEISTNMHFPDYFNSNYDSFSECINDLSWLNSESYIINIFNSKNFLIKEDEFERKKIFEFLENVSTEWANVPNFDGEDEFRKKSIFKIIYL